LLKQSLVKDISAWLTTCGHKVGGRITREALIRQFIVEDGKGTVTKVADSSQASDAAACQIVAASEQTPAEKLRRRLNKKWMRLALKETKRTVRALDSQRIIIALRDALADQTLHGKMLIQDIKEQHELLSQYVSCLNQIRNLKRLVEQHRVSNS
jgi:proline dehydrogenase